MRNVDLNSSLCGQHHGPPDDLESNIQVSFVIGKAAGAKNQASFFSHPLSFEIGKAAGAKNQDFPHHSIGVGHATEGGGAKKSSKFFLSLHKAHCVRWLTHGWGLLA
jgi:hypothetical protein